MLTGTRVIALEEHVVIPELLDAWTRLDPADRDLAFGPAADGETGRRLLEVGDERRAAMTATGVDVQVLSLTTPGLQNLPVNEAVALQRVANDRLAAAVRDDPVHFQGLAALATSAPDDAADELVRAVRRLGLDGAMLYGRTGDRGLDDPALEPIWSAAEELRVPLHLHPQSPPAAVRSAYYDGLPDAVASGFATHAIGWHYDAGVQVLRLVLSGVFDRHPGLRLVVGHWGETVLFYLERAAPLAALARLPRTLDEYVRTHLSVTPSGMLSERYLRWATEVIGVDRILFATDYPFEAASTAGARDFLDRAPVSDPEADAIASGNWEALRARIRR
ncbi:amidohydrolase family protein [Schumannella sp. 10F1B-5-1]|uniref:amidohydrolase family protein n=1 Tax=Schumannella sp. 10F1B-5-1 TaxID=2590780 RepID=UPI0011318C78|nr:amidohydrolase family protein [Schumannella sp. 10F1B-5-1]TPW73165.1 amidohydrolase family protein [Schumannella sp. 10F1B-5-1]